MEMVRIAANERLSSDGNTTIERKKYKLMPPISLVDMLQASGGGLVVPLPPCGPPVLGCFLAWTLVLALCFFFSPFLGCFLLVKFGRVSSLKLF
jgi:hypothetical protein